MEFFSLARFLDSTLFSKCFISFVEINSVEMVVWPFPSGGGKYVLVHIIIVNLKCNCEKQQVTPQGNKQC